MDTKTLKNKPKITREDLAKLLSSIGKPGENQAEKIEAVKQLQKINFQGHSVELTLPSYAEF